MSNTLVILKKPELITVCQHLGSCPVFGVVRVAHLYSLMCCVFLFCLSSSCVPFVASFSGLSILDYPFDFLKRIFH